MKPVYIYRAAFVEVIDGDTVDVQIDLGFKITAYERVRLNNIDAPESYGPTASARGKAAKDFVIGWMAFAKELTLHSLKYDHREKYGRVLGDLYRVNHKGESDPISLGTALRTAGHVK
jgi:micrococcal nuclease